MLFHHDWFDIVVQCLLVWVLVFSRNFLTLGNPVTVLVHWLVGNWSSRHPTWSAATPLRFSRPLKSTHTITDNGKMVEWIVSHSTETVVLKSERQSTIWIRYVKSFYIGKLFPFFQFFSITYIQFKLIHISYTYVRTVMDKSYFYLFVSNLVNSCPWLYMYATIIKIEDLVIVCVTVKEEVQWAQSQEFPRRRAWRHMIETGLWPPKTAKKKRGHRKKEKKNPNDVR